ncbi:hypothetical protein [Chitinimonas sp. BJYL2]|uniref:hypothetical protein n=1 Tax=Chitinimonas sp. BJYL2 TaxID=2976696 RepID=UPI0022B3C6F0|nr:hypothetical protein [Chitinimonas sp. BJYL2]
MIRLTMPCLLAALAPPLLAADFTLTSGWGYSDYDDPLVREWSVPLGFSYRSSDWSVDASGNWRQQRASVDQALAGRTGFKAVRVGQRLVWVPVQRPRPDGALGRVNGWGDVNLNLGRSFSFGEENDPWGMDWRAGVKLPTGSEEKGFSTGKTDWSLSASLSRGFGPYQLSWSSGYSWLGKPAGQTTRNVWNSDLYLGYENPQGFGMGMDYAWSQNATPGYPSSRSVSLSGYLPLGETGRLGINLMRGLSDDDPQQDISITYSYRFP